MNSTYEIRNLRNKPLFAFDNIERAKTEVRAIEKRLSIKVRLIEVMRVEREIEL